jgi:hypothetical protein
VVGSHDGIAAGIGGDVAVTVADEPDRVAVDIGTVRVGGPSVASTSAYSDTPSLFSALRSTSVPSSAAVGP